MWNISIRNNKRKKKINMQKLNDYELISLAQEQNEDAINLIYKKYQPMITKICKKYEKIFKKVGLEIEDLIQESNIVLDKTIQQFNEKENVSFYTYLNRCLKNNIISLFRKNQKESYKILNEAIYLDDELFDGEEKTLHNFIESPENSPDQKIIEEEKYNKFFNKVIKHLSDLEECVLILKNQNFNYKEIADILDKDEKSIDNTIQRIRIKIKKIMAKQ